MNLDIALMLNIRSRASVQMLPNTGKQLDVQSAVISSLVGIFALITDHWSVLLQRMINYLCEAAHAIQNYQGFSLLCSMSFYGFIRKGWLYIVWQYMYMIVHNVAFHISWRCNRFFQNFGHWPKIEVIRGRHRPRGIVICHKDLKQQPVTGPFKCMYL